MKRKISLILYSVVQIFISIYSMFNVKGIAKEQVKLIGEMIKSFPKDVQGMFSELYTVEAMTSSIWLTAILTLVIGFILLWLIVRNRISVKKRLTILLIIATIILGLDSLINILAFIALFLVIGIKKEDKEPKQKKEISKLSELKITNKDLVWTIILLLAYSIQFFVPNLIVSTRGLIAFDFLYNVSIFILVFYVFKDRYKRDFKELKENFGVYIGFIFKSWIVMLGLSFVVGIIRIIIGGDMVTANQETLNSVPLWYVGPLAVIWAPVVEEAIFRGSIRRFIKKDILFIIVSAISFGLLHTMFSETGLYNILIQSLQYIVMGGVMAYVYTKTNNIFVNMGVHFIQNSLGFILMILISLI